MTPEIASRVGLSIDALTALMILDTIKGFGPQRTRALTEAGFAPAEVIQSPEKLPIGGRHGENFRRALGEATETDASRARQRAVRQILRASENDAAILTHTHPAYPPRVYKSNNPVPILYIRGKDSILSEPRAIALVGSRNIRSPYDVLHAKFARAAVSEDFVIVSGFATGADKIGHETAFRGGGNTILVMPCGLDRPFPPENRQLWDDLLAYEDALIVSEFHFGTKAAALTLRKRNKLIVAFSQGVLISQSSADGGAMNAYRFAIDQRKPVATFEPDGTKETTGNAEIKQGPPWRTLRSHDDALLAVNGVAPTTVLPANSGASGASVRWLRRLSTSPSSL